MSEIRHMRPRIRMDVGGEGSRGGKIVGHTTSGKPIYASAKNKAHVGFEEHERKEAGMIRAGASAKVLGTAHDRLSGVTHVIWAVENEPHVSPSRQTVFSAPQKAGQKLPLVKGYKEHQAQHLGPKDEALKKINSGNLTFTPKGD